MFTLKVTKKVETESGIVLTFTPFEGEQKIAEGIPYNVGMETEIAIGDEFEVIPYVSLIVEGEDVILEEIIEE